MKAFLLFILTAALSFAGTAAPNDRIRIDLVEPADRPGPVHDFPITAGLVFPPGALSSVPGGRLVDDRGRTVPVEAKATGWWHPEKKDVKWLRLRFRGSTDRHYFFEPGPPGVAPRGEPIARREGRAIVVDTGILQARLDAAHRGLFQDIRLGGKPIARSDAGDLILVIDDGGRPQRLTNAEWTMELEESTSQQATVKASGVWQREDRQPAARFQIRCTFHQGEAFVRLEHTLIWMIRDERAGIRELSLAIATDSGTPRRLQAGTSEITGATADVALAGGRMVEAVQEDADTFAVRADGRPVPAGKRWGGWVALEGSDGRTTALSLRHAWQRYPAGFRVAEGRIRLDLCPPSQRLSFLAEDIMGPGIYRHPTWIRVRRTYSAPGNDTHFYDNYEPRPGYDYSAEGAAFTHEIVLSFHGPDAKRTPAQLNNLNQYRIAARQDPARALAVPFLGGFRIAPLDVRVRPEIERAVDQLGRMAMGRWTGAQNFGLLRFGMVRWGRHERIEDPAANFYRWMDNGQYNQQLIPWLLFLRGGDRQFFDDAEIVSRFAMDLSTNHYNTRGSPTGYIAGCGSALPFAPFGFSTGNMKMQKVHFLSYYHHLTGDRRAREVMEEVLEGTKAFTLEVERTQRAAHPGRDFHDLSNGGREMYNMNVFWATAWEETGDPEIRRLGRNGLSSTIHGQYRPATNSFNGPHVYVYDGLVPQQRLFGDAAARDVMLRHLNIDALTTHGGLAGGSAREDSIGFPWAYEQTGDRRFAEAAWDIARGMADLVPEIDFSGERPPEYYPYEYTGNSLFRSHLMPILTGATLGRDAGLGAHQPPVFRDLFFQMWRHPGEPEHRTEIYLRARRAGRLALRCLLKGDPMSPATLEVTRADGRVVARSTLAAGAFGPPPGPYTPFQADVVVEDAQAGELFRVTLRKADPAPVAVLSAEAQVVHYLPSALRHAHEPLCSAQNFTPIRFVTRTNAPTMSHVNRLRRPYTVRDAETHELIFRPRLFTEEESTHAVRSGRLVVLTGSGCRSTAEWRMTGVEPYFAASREDWFHPGEAGWPHP